VTAKDKDARPEDYYYVRTRFRADLPNAKTIGKRAAQKALDKIGQDKIESGDYTMIVENSAMSRLIWMLIAPMHARSIQQKQSYLEGMLNKKIASEKLTITDNPFIKKGLGSRLFDNDGIAAQTRVMIENGVLKNYYVDPYYGRKLKMDPTTNGSSNLEFNSGNQSLNQMINSVNKGIFVTGFIGGNSNQTTGDFSFGISGRLIEKGKLSIPVNEMNISGNSKEFWNKLTVIGNDPYPYSSILRPSMLFEDIAFSGL
jgi:PmbA protein